MRLPFTHEQFLDAFAAYSTALWPAALLLWLATAGALLLVHDRVTPRPRDAGPGDGLKFGWSSDLD